MQIFGVIPFIKLQNQNQNQNIYCPSTHWQGNLSYDTWLTSVKFQHQFMRLSSQRTWTRVIMLGMQEVLGGAVAFS